VDRENVNFVEMCFLIETSYFLHPDADFWILYFSTVSIEVPEEKPLRFLLGPLPLTLFFPDLALSFRSPVSFFDESRLSLFYTPASSFCVSVDSPLISIHELRAVGSDFPPRLFTVSATCHDEKGETFFFFFRPIIVPSQFKKKSRCFIQQPRLFPINLVVFSL